MKATKATKAMPPGRVKMSRIRLTILGLACLALIATVAVAPTAVDAHHAFSAEFDANRPVDLEGTVLEMEWINPHAWIHIEVASESGETEQWSIEAGAPNGLIRRGFTRDSLLPGTKILVSGYRAKDGANRANGSSITFEDGRKLFVGGSNPDLPENQQ
jgi:hypothetical protein